jgi:hypothetical protein
MGATMIVLAVVLWVCGIMPGTCQIPGEPWLPTLRERLERQENEVLVERAEREKALKALDPSADNSSSDGWS